MITPLLLRQLCLRLLAATTLMTPSALLAEDVILIDGSSTVYPITRLAGKAYEVETADQVLVKVHFSGTTAGFRKFVKGEIDISDASRPILQKEIDAAKANGVAYIEIPLAYDALTIAVNPENQWLHSIKTSELKKLWEPESEGTLTRWNQINPEWPDEEIVLLGAGGDSGTYDYFAEVITGGKTLRQDYIGSEDDNVIVDGIAKNPNALGFLPYSYVYNAKDRIKPVAVEQDLNARTGESIKGQPIEPSSKTVYQGIYTPLGRPLFLYVNVKSLDKKPYLVDFLDFFMNNAGTFVRRVHYLPLSDVAYKRAMKSIKHRQTGTRFDGRPATGISHHRIISLEPK